MSAVVDIDALRALLKQKLADSDGLVALRNTPSGVLPHVFDPQDDLADLALMPWYRAATLVRQLQHEKPEARLVVLVRGCDERALIEMAKRNQVDLDKLTLVGIPCSSEEMDCFCERPAPGKIDIGEAEPGKRPEQIDQYLEMPQEERLAFWRTHVDRCIKCYGCRNICPVCFCEECALEEESWVDHALLPPPLVTFHIIRAMHMAERCIRCGQCEAACPADIPLTILYRLISEEVKDKFGYESGISVDDKPVMALKEENP